MGWLKICTCSLANQDHQRSLRSYAHVGHLPRTICVAGAYWNLPVGHQRGLFWHEVGHLLLARRSNHREAVPFMGLFCKSNHARPAHNAPPILRRAIFESELRKHQGMLASRG